MPLPFVSIATPSYTRRPTNSDLLYWRLEIYPGTESDFFRSTIDAFPELCSGFTETEKRRDRIGKGIELGKKKKN